MTARMKIIMVVSRVSWKWTCSCDQTRFCLQCCQQGKNSCILLTDCVLLPSFPLHVFEFGKNSYKFYYIFFYNSCMVKYTDRYFLGRNVQKYFFVTLYTRYYRNMHQKLCNLFHITLKHLCQFSSESNNSLSVQTSWLHIDCIIVTFLSELATAVSQELL